MELEVRFRQSHRGDAAAPGRARRLGPVARVFPSLPPAAAPGGAVVSTAPWPHFAFSLGFIKILMTSIFLFSFLLM